jgi:hypothetical protein
VQQNDRGTLPEVVSGQRDIGGVDLEGVGNGGVERVGGL